MILLVHHALDPQGIIILCTFLDSAINIINSSTWYLIPPLPAPIMFAMRSCYLS